MALFVPKRGWPRAALLAAWVGLLFPGSCHKQPPATVPPQAQPPTVTQPQPATTPPQETAPAEAKPAATTAPESTSGPAPAPVPPPKAKHPHRTTKKVVPAPTSPAAPPAAPGDTPGKTVVPQGSAPATGTQLTPNLTPEEAERRRQGTVQLLAATEANLKNLATPLTAEQQATVEEIHSYMTQARGAMAEGDLGRAYNLADKAHQLSNALPKK